LGLLDRGSGSMGKGLVAPMMVGEIGRGTTIFLGSFR
jgi:hypothetical protein